MLLEEGVEVVEQVSITLTAHTATLRGRPRDVNVSDRRHYFSFSPRGSTVSGRESYRREEIALSCLDKGADARRTIMDGGYAALRTLCLSFVLGLLFTGCTSSESLSAKNRVRVPTGLDSSADAAACEAWARRSLGITERITKPA